MTLIIYLDLPLLNHALYSWTTRNSLFNLIGDLSSADAALPHFLCAVLEYLNEIERHRMTTFLMVTRKVTQREAHLIMVCATSAKAP